jgi:predicted O-methyltransferase YrrM
MTSQVKAVLDAYHQRIEQERQQRANATQPLGDDWRDNALLAVGPETGQLINILAKSLNKPNIVEIGTSFGYSGIWLADAARASGGRVTTLELKQHKSDYAKAQANKAGLAEYVDFKVGDALQLLDEIDFGIDFVLLDLGRIYISRRCSVFIPS